MLIVLTTDLRSIRSRRWVAMRRPGTTNAHIVKCNPQKFHPSCHREIAKEFSVCHLLELYLPNFILVNLCSTWKVKKLGLLLRGLWIYCSLLWMFSSRDPLVSSLFFDQVIDQRSFCQRPFLTSVYKIASVLLQPRTLSVPFTLL